MPVMKMMPDFARDAKERGVPEIGCDELVELLANDPDMKLIDVREKGEWLCGRMPRAQHVPRGIIESNLATDAYNGRITDEDLDRTIVFYCGCGDRSVLVTERAAEMGFRDPRSLEGGYREWIRQGGDVIVDPRFTMR